MRNLSSAFNPSWESFGVLTPHAQSVYRVASREAVGTIFTVFSLSWPRIEQTAHQCQRHSSTAAIMDRFNWNKLCEVFLCLKDMESGSANALCVQTVVIIGNNWSYICRWRERLRSWTSNTMGQGRLSSLALLAIERTVVKSSEKMPYYMVRDHSLKKKLIVEYTSW